MAQTTILDADTTAAISSDVAVAAGATVKIGIFATGADIPEEVQVSVRIDTPGDDARAGVLNWEAPVQIFDGPGTIRGVRPDISAYGVAVGIYTET